jgi:hypothetical protein
MAFISWKALSVHFLKWDKWICSERRFPLRVADKKYDSSIFEFIVPLSFFRSNTKKPMAGLFWTAVNLPPISARREVGLFSFSSQAVLKTFCFDKLYQSYPECQITNKHWL